MYLWFVKNRAWGHILYIYRVRGEWLYNSQVPVKYEVHKYLFYKTYQYSIDYLAILSGVQVHCLNKTRKT